MNKFIRTLFKNINDIVELEVIFNKKTIILKGNFFKTDNIYYTNTSQVLPDNFKVEDIILYTDKNNKIIKQYINE